ncbi:MAG TPA: HAMP domain-containing sensor histidine kinase, partial [Spirochaetia bacterium]|nr:HAMP domain-containing sensor histidine kinase [Spirochaetia bacterium]
FINLINNSIEAIQRDAGKKEKAPEARSGRWIRVITKQIGATAFVEFCDGGPGFTPDGLKHAFDTFHRASSPVGMGIGLSICLQIIQAIGGTIRVQNGPVGGACFTIELPCAHKATPPDSTGAGQL